MIDRLTKYLLCIVVACGACLAQSGLELKFREAVRHLRLGQREQALAKLEQVLAADPSNAQALHLWQQTDAAIFTLLLEQQGDFAKIARMLANRAAAARSVLSNDQQSIRELVEAALRGASFAVRDQAMAALIADHGGYATPALAEVIGDPDEDSAANRAILVLTRIGAGAVLPLIEALASDNHLLRRNAGAALAHIADRRSAPALARMAQDEREAVRRVANQALKAIGIPAGADPVELFLAQSRRYLESGGVGSSNTGEVVWNLVAGKLAPAEIPGPIYHLELAKRHAEAARRQDPASEQALVLQARSYLGQAATLTEYASIEDSSEAMVALAQTVPSLRRVALAAGPAILRQVLRESIQARQIPVAVMAIEALAETETRKGLDDSPLLAALGNSDARIAYAAALAICKLGAGGPIPSSERVVRILANAVTEESILLVKVVAGDQAAAIAAREADSSQRGIAVDVASSGKVAISEIYNFPDYDVVVVADDLPDLHSQDVIQLILRRNPSIKILALTTDKVAAIERGTYVDGVIEGPLTGETLIAEVDQLLGIGAGASRSRAQQVAIAASEALYDLARAGIDVSSAISKLVAQLDREDAVALPAAEAIGAGGDLLAVDSLLAVLADDSASLALRGACAVSLGSIIGRADRLPHGCFATMLAIATDAEQDPGLRSSVVTALGRGRLSPGERLKFTEGLKVLLGVSSKF